MTESDFWCFPEAAICSNRGMDGLEGGKIGDFIIDLSCGVERGWRIGEVIAKKVIVKFPISGGEFTVMISLDADIKGDDDGVVIREKVQREIE
ncbi:hypothetical protein CEXT_317061 [Caerostris extrusa]|uniref:Uncharacterized protein n=1 Tax=Caerostris extrusa TaxID=172846 RepID=A0AAV4UMC6_CAEEX|nr:hypothetical protein CEXT_317061 [Caerostris extrusa]